MLHDLATGWPKKLAQFLLNTLTLSNINRFSIFFHCQNLEKICNRIIAKDPTTPQVSSVSLHYLVKWQCLKSNNWKRCFLSLLFKMCCYRSRFVFNCCF